MLQHSLHKIQVNYTNSQRLYLLLKKTNYLMHVNTLYNWWISVVNLLKTDIFIYFYQCQPSKIAEECASTLKAVERLQFPIVLLPSGLAPSIFTARFVQVHKSILHLIPPLSSIQLLAKASHLNVIRPSCLRQPASRKHS